MDINRALRNVIATGTVAFGTEQAKKAMKSGKAKLIIRAKNCPVGDFGTQDVYEFSGTNQDLGTACGKPFAISVLTVMEEGDSDILALKKESR